MPSEPPRGLRKRPLRHEADRQDALDRLTRLAPPASAQGGWTPPRRVPRGRHSRSAPAETADGGSAVEDDVGDERVPDDPADDRSAGPGLMLRLAVRFGVTRRQVLLGGDPRGHRVCLRGGPGLPAPGAGHRRTSDVRGVDAGHLHQSRSRCRANSGGPRGGARRWPGRPTGPGASPDRRAREGRGNGGGRTLPGAPTCPRSISRGSSLTASRSWSPTGPAGV